ncbi:hypothetical protein HPB47_017547 [Ixodes persulcatus]|uniref:Uncharacterized protein n=1 Tax=Ixodes persulcatus TaxID=34615 RepID=A0AC60QN08_IXOPE|nr:hypothetical protein HPB47_017547 [Ixodes persulcatus]
MGPVSSRLRTRARGIEPRILGSAERTFTRRAPSWCALAQTATDPSIQIKLNPSLRSVETNRSYAGELAASGGSEYNRIKRSASPPPLRRIGEIIAESELAPLVIEFASKHKTDSGNSCVTKARDILRAVLAPHERRAEIQRRLAAASRRRTWTLPVNLRHKEKAASEALLRSRMHDRLQDSVLFSQWDRNIPRGNTHLQANSAVCALHFDERYIEPICSRYRCMSDVLGILACC